MRRNLSSVFLQGLITAGVISLGVTGFGCADGSSPTGSTASAGVGGGGGESGSGGAGGDDASSSTTKASSAAVTTGAGGGSGTGGSEGTGGNEGTGGSGEGGEGGGNACGVECPVGLHDVDNNPLTGECGCEYSCTVTSNDDPIDENFTDANCDGGDGVVESCVYVSAALGNDANGGTRDAPKQTIASAITHAVDNGVPAVCLSGEPYAESVNVASGVSIYGGFDHTNPDFAFRRSADATTLVTAEGTVFYADNIAVDTHIEGLSIEATAPPTPGESVYGVRLRTGVGRLYVRYNDIRTADATDGIAGVNGAPPPVGVAPVGNDGENGYENDATVDDENGEGGPAPVCSEPGGKGGGAGYSSNSSGADGDPGNGGALGGAEGGGVSPCGDGGPGLQGDAGFDPTVSGDSGGGGQNIGRIDVATAGYVPSNGLNGSNGAAGKGGGGGGGGGGGPHRQWSLSSWCVQDRGGGGGSGGCGGIGGKLGTGAGGGGGSFGVFAAGGKVTVTDNEIQTGFGGDGARGGNGGDRQLGGGGGLGGASDEGSSSFGGSGGNGGRGGHGAVGGPGGGGGGGPSLCFAHASATQSDYDDNSCSTAGAGIGGQGGTNPAQGQGGPGAGGQVGFDVTINTL